MAAVPIAEAARRIGHRSRSQLYRLIDAGSLRDYLRRGPDGARLLELKPQGLPSLAERVADCTAERINSAPRPRPKPEPATDAPRPFDVIAELWAPITPRINRELIAQGLLPLSPEHVLAVVAAAEDAIRADFPEWDPETPEWWAATLKDASPDDPCTDPWRCEHCGEPWHVNHPDYRQPPAVAAYVAALRECHGRAAGPIRNRQLLRRALLAAQVMGSPGLPVSVLVVAFPGGRGTASLVNQAKALDVEVVAIDASSAALSASTSL